MKREFTCIICPNGCEITADIAENENDSPIISFVEGAECPRGKQYAEQELKDPKRNIATLVLVKGGELPVTSVRLTNPIPKNEIFHAMAEIRECCLAAPVTEGSIIIKNLLGYDTDVIVTKSIRCCS